MACYPAPQAQANCPVNIQFSGGENEQPWRAINDAVMGGRSSGGPSIENGSLIFSGNINTNGGGFSSIRTRLEPGVLSGLTEIMMRIKSDGRAYELTTRTDVTYGRRPISFQMPIPATNAGKWAEVTIPFDRVEASLFGREVRGAPFDPAFVWELGIILADGKDGPFSLSVDWIKACKP